MEMCMKRLAAALAVMIVPVTQAQELPRQFDLHCKDVKRGGSGDLEDAVSLKLSVDLDRGLACRAWYPDCFVTTAVDRGRWIDLSYRFTSGRGETYEMSRIWDRESGWLDQRVIKIGTPGSPYGDAVCTIAPYTPFEDTRAARTPPANMR
jgi:hypothetical protein